ncbi:MAG TPA: NADP-dependent isocitrate dehydrogenase [Phycisphaerales bacterium]|nr:NADP-dependent isocitrate dehydrogenase [Phycisphaerales bacterium]
MTPVPATAQTFQTAASAKPAPITVARGDGIGPDIMGAVLFLLDQAGAALDLEHIEVGRSVYERGNTAGIEPDAWASLRRTGILLKAPITTPQGKGYKSLNVTIRKTLGLFANVRPCPTYHPFIPTAHPGMDVVIIRENEEDTYGGIEHRQTPEVTQCLKLITRPGCEKVVRYAFDYARQQGRRKVTCFVKDNIMKMTDGLFHEVFDRIAAEYPEIKSDTRIVDIGSARLAKDPTQFDVVVLPNLYGDIVSDIAAEIAGSVGIAGSANIGDHCAMFEAIHGSAPDIAGKGVANPSGLLHAAILMLDHIGQADVAERLHNAWLRTIEDGVLTADMCSRQAGGRYVGTDAFAHAVANRLGQMPQKLPTAVHRQIGRPARTPGAVRLARPAKELLGVDVFLDWDEPGRDPATLGAMLETLAGPDLALRMISNRGTKVYPNGHPETFCTDHWRCRFFGAAGGAVSHEQVLALLGRISARGLDFIKTEHLYTFDGKPGYSLGQGE